jgi:hypothetical protein
MSKPALGMVAMIFVAGIAFGYVQPARSDTSGDDTATLQAMFNNVQPGATLTLDRRVYPHGGVVTITVPNVHIEGNGATLAATNDLTSAVEIRANGVSVSNLNLTAPIGGKRYNGTEQQKLYVFHADGLRLDDITVTGSAAAGVLLDGVSNFVLNRVTVRDSRADGIHLTRGSNNGQVNNPLTERTGDDGISVVSYGPKFVGVNEPPCRNITIESPVVNGTTHAHGVTVRGGENITYRNVQVSGTSGAGVFVDTEGAPFFLQSVNGATVEGGTVTAANTTEATGALVAYGQNPETVTSNVTFSDLTIVNTSELAPSNIAVVTANGGAVSNIMFRNIAIQQHSQKPVLFANTPRETYTLSGITLNGKPYNAA